MDLLVVFITGFGSGSIISFILFYLYLKRKSGVSVDRDLIKSISVDVLKEASEQNIKLTENLLKSVSYNTATIFDEKRSEIDSLVVPLRDELANYREQIEKIENIRREDYGNIRNFLDTIGETTARIKQETLALNQMLKNSQSRGRWGEITLRKVVENAGLTEHIDFEEQVQGTGGERPDMIIHLPGSKEVVVDSKAPYKKFIESFEETVPEKKEEIMKEFATDLKKQIKNLNSKQYFEKITGSFQFTVMFLPHESMLNAAVGTDPEILDYALLNNIVMATPLTLFALLKVIQMSWKEDSMLKNSGELIKISGNIYERMEGMYERINRVGKNINSLVKDYNSLISFSESRVLPSLKRMNQIGELGKTETVTGTELEELTREPMEEKWNKFERTD